jgi:hypothetical protein
MCPLRQALAIAHTHADVRFVALRKDGLFEVELVRSIRYSPFNMKMKTAPLKLIRRVILLKVYWIRLGYIYM